MLRTLLGVVALDIVLEVFRDIQDGLIGFVVRVRHGRAVVAVCVAVFSPNVLSESKCFFL